MIRPLSLVAALAATIAIVPSARATHGYFGYGYSTKQKGMGGAGAALPLDSLQSAVNPAGLVYVGNRYDFGFGLYSIRPRYTVEGAPSGYPGTFGLAPETVNGKRDFIISPHGGWNKMLDARGSIGVATYTNGGANTRYPASAANGLGTFYGGKAGAKLEQQFVQAAYSRMVGDHSSLGLGFLLAYQRLAASGLSSFAPFVADGTPDKLTNQGTSHALGYGFKLGAMSDVSPGVTLAASYQTALKMGRHDEYADLMPNRGRVDVPPTATMGVAWRPDEKNTVALDLQRIWYSKTAGTGNPFGNLHEFREGDPSYGLGGPNGPGLGWRDVTVLKIGGQHALNDSLTARAGISYGRQPIPDTDVFFNLVAPGVEEWHFTTGLTKELKNGAELTMAAVYVPGKTVNGGNPLEVPGRQMIHLRQGEFGVEVSYGHAF